jgi:hypothetical protein
VPAACEHAPWLGVAETKVTPGGRVSVTVESVEGSGPLFVTVRVYVRLPPRATGSRPPS